METDHPLTLTVEQAGQILGVGRSTAYELVRSGDLASIRLRRRIVVPVAHLAERLGVSPAVVRAAMEPTRPLTMDTSRLATPQARPAAPIEVLRLF